jgi:aryl-alcohol dehydrogenase-like predicted oxidoreductase
LDARATAQLEDSLGAVDLVLSSAEIAEISTVSDWTRARTELEQ